MSRQHADLSCQSQSTTRSSMQDEQKGKQYTMQGVRVNFPYVAYPSQIAIMDKIIRSLRNKHNSLLESPTGSGKSAALLCAALAWQQKELENIEALERAAEEADRTLTENQKKAATNLGNISNGGCSIPSTNQTTQQEGTCTNLETPTNDDDFQPAKRFRTSSMPQNVAALKSPVPARHQEIIIQLPQHLPPNTTVMLNLEEIMRSVKALSNAARTSLPGSNLESLPEPSTQLPQLEKDQETQKPRTAKQPGRPKMHRPKIFFCTRTHKQIKQITKELDRTFYRDVKMCILSSREQTCIHPHVSKQPNKNEGCQDLLKSPEGIQCSLYMKTRGLDQYAIKDRGLNTAWDIEDMVSLGKRAHFCPYFGLRELMPHSDIIFCPYNYVTDPVIRTSMGISLKGNILILDEGHNIEDFAREAASFSVNQRELQEAVQDLETHPSKEGRLFAGILSRVSTWIDRNARDMNDYSDFNRSGKVLQGQDLVAIMTEFDAGPDKLYDLVKMCCTLSGADEGKNVAASTSSLRIIEGLLFTLDFLYRNQLKYMSDFRCVIVKKFVMSNHNDSGSGWRQKTLVPKRSYTHTLNIWCLNPGVCFSDFQEVHSLIITSGTLSPMVSFESELSLKFPIAFEANHIIKNSQVWVGTFGCGPNNVPLKAVYQNTESLQFQDELGQVVLQTCQIVPHGVLCFFPSYTNLDKMVARWQLTGLMARLQNVKVVVTEPRASNKHEFEEILQEFYSAIEEGEGAVFFAVYRGKVSEGLNFADDNARAVIAIGIPYPNLKDIQVDLKQKYNDTHYRSRSLMNGRDWYEAQAFRALNQALGRCIRHRTDWGALILVDQRYQTNSKCVKSLSKWVRNVVFHYSTFAEGLDSLKFFARNVQKMSEVLNMSVPPSVMDTQTSSSGSCLDSGYESVHDLKTPDSHSKKDVIDLCSSPELF